MNYSTTADGLRSGLVLPAEDDGDWLPEIAVSGTIAPSFSSTAQVEMIVPTRMIAALAVQALRLDRDAFVAAVLEELQRADEP